MTAVHLAATVLQPVCCIRPRDTHFITHAASLVPRTHKFESLYIYIVSRRNPGPPDACGVKGHRCHRIFRGNFNRVRATCAALPDFNW